MRSQNKESKSMGMGILFIILVVFVLIISGIIKLIDLVGKSEFNGKNNFNLLYNNGKWEAISLSPANKSISIVSIGNKDISPSNLGIPYDIDFKTDHDISSQNAKSEIIPLLISAHTNPFDVAKIFFFLRSVDSDSIKEINISSKDYDPKDVSEVFIDPSIVDENLSVEISNATGETGVGSYFAKVLTNMGANVVLVSTNQEALDKSVLITDNLDSQTAEKIKQMYQLKTENKKPEVSDVKIIIGKDLLSKIK